MRPILCSLLLGLLAFGCDDEAEQTVEPIAEPSTAVEAPPAKDPSADKQPAAKPVPKVETKTYVAELRASSNSDTPLSVGDKAKLLVTIRPQNGWHMNHEFPTSVVLAQSDAMTTGKAKVEKSDAKRFDDDGADFELPVEVKQGGKHQALADLSFAVCTEQTCLPEKLQLALTLDIAQSDEQAPAEQKP